MPGILDLGTKFCGRTLEKFPRDYSLGELWPVVWPELCVDQGVVLPITQ